MSSQQAPSVALIVDHPLRDLGGLVLTALELCHRGATCHLVPLNLQDKEIWALAPDFVLLNFLRRGTEHLARQLNEAGIRFGLLDTEGGVWADPSKYTELLWSESDLRFSARCACMWGSGLADYTIRHGFFAEKQVRITGCPRFDLYAEPWREMFAGPDGMPAHEPSCTVLINTNFSLSNPRCASRDGNARMATDHYGWSAEETRRVMDAEQRALAAFIGIARSIVHDFPSLTVVLRPHPFESLEPYRHGLAGLDRVHVRSEGDVQSEIFRSIAVIQRSCTTAIESTLASIPTFSPLWIEAPFENPMAEAVSDGCPSYDELRRRLERVVRDEYVTNDEVLTSRGRVIEEWFSTIDGLSHQRVADSVMDCIPERRTTDVRLCEKLLYHPPVPKPSLPEFARQMVRRRLGMSPDWSFRDMRNRPTRLHESKRFTVDQVQGVAERLARVTGGTLSGRRRVKVMSPQDHGDYASAYAGQSVTLACD